MSASDLQPQIVAATAALQQLGPMGRVLVEDVTPRWLPQVYVTKVHSKTRFNEWGRGLTLSEAHLGGLMERVERVTAFQADHYKQCISVRPVDANLPVVKLTDLGLTNAHRFLRIEESEGEQENHFVEVQEAGTNAPHLAPASRVFLGYRRGLTDFACSSGLAAHFDADEARQRAAIEVLERHVHHLVVFNQIRDASQVHFDYRHAENARLAALLKALAQASFTVTIFQIPQFSSLHSLVVFLRHRSDPPNLSRHSRFHCAVHWSAEHAVERAITEIVVNRYNEGWRPGGGTRRSVSSRDQQLPSVTSVSDIPISSLVTLPYDDRWDELLRIVRERDSKLYLCDLSAPGSGVVVVRALITRLQPNFDLLGRRPMDYRSCITPHLKAYESWVRDVMDGKFIQQHVVEKVPSPAANSAAAGDEDVGTSTQVGGTAQIAFPPIILDFSGERTPLVPEKTQLADVMSQRQTRRDVTRPISLTAVATILRWGVGHKGPHVGQRFGFFSRRNYPSPGARHSIEVFAEARAVDGLEPGLYHYSPLRCELTKLASIDVVRPLRNNTMQCPPALLLYLWSDVRRLRAKYNTSVKRFGVLEAGHLAQNIFLLCEELGARVTPVGANIGHRLRGIVPTLERMRYVYALAVGGPE